MLNLLTKLIKPILQKSTNVDLEKIIEPQGLYAKHFLEALKTSEELLLKTPKVEFQSRRMLTNDLLNKIPKHVERRIGRLPIEEVAGQCIAIHYRIKKPLEELFNTELYYTIGYVENQFDNRFYHDKNDIINLLQSGMNKPKLELHTWLTFPSMEIIDYSLLSTYAYARNRPDHYFAVLANHADELKNGMIYHPTIVGEDFLLKIGAIKQISLS